MTLCESGSVNRHKDIESLPDDWQQRILHKVVTSVMQTAAGNKDWSREAADYYHNNANEAAEQRAVDAWWEAGAPIPEIDGLNTVSSDGPAFVAWARSYIGLN